MVRNPIRERNQPPTETGPIRHVLDGQPEEGRIEHGATLSLSVVWKVPTSWFNTAGIRRGRTEGTITRSTQALRVPILTILLPVTTSRAISLRRGRFATSGVSDYHEGRTSRQFEREVRHRRLFNFLSRGGDILHYRNEAYTAFFPIPGMILELHTGGVCCLGAARTKREQLGQPRGDCRFLT